MTHPVRTLAGVRPTLRHALVLAALLLPCGCSTGTLPYNSGQGALGGLDGAAMMPQSAGSGASINGILTPGGGGETTGPGGIYPPLE